MTETLSNYGREDLKGIDWKEELEIAKALNKKDDTLEYTDYRTILPAIRSNLPLVIKTKKNIAERIHIETNTYMVQYIQMSNSGSSYIRVHSWGGVHMNMYLADIVSLETPGYSLDPTDEYV